jgi:hypothetical protein
MTQGNASQRERGQPLDAVGERDCAEHAAAPNAEGEQSSAQQKLPHAPPFSG